MFGVKPYISFKGNCAEAINFYKDAIGAETLYVGRWGDSPMKGKVPDEAIMHCTLKIGYTHLMVCDSMSPDHPVNVGNNISLAIGTSDIASAEASFNKMAVGGTVVMPMQETFWAERFGMLTDKFGINWMFNVDKPESDHAKATA